MDQSERTDLIERYRTGTADVEAAVAGITDEELDRPPADPDSWTARQVAHHLADSEAMAYIRLRRLLAENEPVIAGYDEPEWARRLHYDRPIASSLAVLAAVRAASLELMEQLSEDEWTRVGTHSDSGLYGVETWLGIYAAHAHDHAPAQRLGFRSVWINRRHDRPAGGATPPADARPDAT
ncbi:MAG TPA: DinB family protein, partial [Candidatus Deferrimicrobium sp.]|nr:DinB family protein [Candidatus Deferrimicrobium sp.]